MKKDDEMSGMTAFLIVVGVLVVLVGFGLLCGHELTNKAWKKEAVEMGHAEWYIQDHERQWRWKPTPGVPPTKKKADSTCPCGKSQK